MLQESVAAAQLHFKEQALGFMDRRRTRQRNGLAGPRSRKVLLVAGMSGFVDHAEKRAEQFIFIVTRGDTHIFRHAAAERVGANVQTTAVKIEAKHFHRFQAQLALRGGREGTLWRNERSLSLFFHNLCQQLRQPGLQIAEQHIQASAGHVGFKDIQQRVVRRAAFSLSAQAGLFTTEFHHLFQVG